MTSRRFIISSFISGLFILWSFSANPPQGRTGAPGESTCASSGCHSGVNPIIRGHLEIQGLPQTLHQNTPYNLQLDLIVDSGSPARGGFQLTGLTKEGTSLDFLLNPPMNTTLSTSNNRIYWEHDPALSFEGDTLSYIIEMAIPDSVTTEEIVIYAAANFANGNGGSSGDRIVTLSDTFSVSPAELNLEAIITPITCPDGANGAIELEVFGGSPPYTYSWSTLDTASSVTNLDSGFYHVAVMDSEQSLVADTFFITPGLDTFPPEIKAVKDTIIIQSCARFSYPQPTATDECGAATIAQISGKGNNQSFEPGIHYEIFEATDDFENVALCTIIIKNVTLIHPMISINDIACFEDSLGSIDVDVTGTNPAFDIVVDAGVINPDSIPQGTHSIRIIDQTGCTITSEIEIRRPDSLVLTIDQISNPLSSSSGDGSIEISVVGGTPPYSFNWRTENENFSEDEDLELLFPGEYVVHVSDQNLCVAISDTIKLDATTRLTDVNISTRLSIYPNPSTDFIKLNHEGLRQPRWVSLFNHEGHNLGQMELSEGFIDISHLLPGTYHLIILFEDQKKGLTTFVKL